MWKNQDLYFSYELWWRNGSQMVTSIRAALQVAVSITEMPFLPFKYNTSDSTMVCICVHTDFLGFFSCPRWAWIQNFYIGLIPVQGRWRSTEHWKFLLVSCCPGMCLCGFHRVKMTHCCLISQRRERSSLLSPREGIFLMDMHQRHAYLT